MVKKMYIAKYSRGDWDDYYQFPVFVSADKRKVTNWVTKFNRIHKEYLKMYEPYLSREHSFPWIADEYSEKYGDKWYRLKKINKAFWEEIELR